MSGPWRVLDGSGHGIESHKSPRAARRAMLIFSAHEIKNGRVADYRIEPPIDLDPNIEGLDLPEWALQVLRGEKCSDA